MRRHAFCAIPAAALALALAGCFTDDPLGPITTPPRDPVSFGAGAFTVRLDPDKRDLALMKGDVVLLDLPADALQLGVVPALDDAVNYDPYTLVVPSVLHAPPDGLAWLKPKQVDVTSADATSVLVALTYPEGLHASLRIEAPRDGSFKLTLTPDGTGSGAVAYFRLRARADAKEGFYGLGEYFDDVNSRGKVRAMQLEIDGASESSYNNVHVPIPFVIGTRGWGLFVETRYPGVFEVATQADDVVAATFGTGLHSTDGLVFHLFAEDKPLDLTRHYYDVTGYPRLPASWALGPWVWRNDAENQAQAESDLQTMRDLDLAATAYWVDRPYATAVQTFDWDPKTFPMPQQLIDKAHALGFGLALWHTPYFDKKAPETADLLAQAEAMGFYPKTTGLPLNPWGKLIDFTNPDAYAWWQNLVSGYTSMGVEGFKLDYGEDVVPGLTAGRNVWEFADGSDERTMHAGYALLYHRVYAETLPSSGSFLLCRHGVYGDQQNVSVIWPGDLDATFARGGEMATDGTKSYVSVGGMPGSLIAGLGLGPSGFPFFGADTGGYLHSPPDKELFTRWFEQTALSTVMQMGNGASTVAWEPDPATGYDAEMLGWYRTYTRLHLRLFPYEWTYAKNLAKDGRAIARPLGLAYPELGEHPSDTYLFGDVLLVAPVVARGVTSRAVLLPAGKWIDWWTGKVVDGGAAVTVDAPLGTLPLFLQEGGIVPMLRPTIDTLRETTKPSLADSYATDPGVLYVRVAPGAASTFTVFDGTALTQERAGARVKLSSADGQEFTSGALFEVIAAGARPSKVTEGATALTDRGTLAGLEAAPSGWAYAADLGGTVYVKTGAGKHAVEIAP
jgi:alpha-D-xyloside xylohydrolase